MTGANTLVSGTPGPTVSPGDQASFLPVISADGSTIAFQTLATNLAPAFPGMSANHVIYCTRVPLSCTIADQTPAGQPANGLGQLPRLSADGRFVAFESLAGNLLPCTFCGFNVYVRDMLLRSSSSG